MLWRGIWLVGCALVLSQCKTINRGSSLRPEAPKPAPAKDSFALVAADTVDAAERYLDASSHPDDDFGRAVSFLASQEQLAELLAHPAFQDFASAQSIPLGLTSVLPNPANYSAYFPGLGLLTLGGAAIAGGCLVQRQDFAVWRQEAMPRLVEARERLNVEYKNAGLSTQRIYDDVVKSRPGTFPNYPPKILIRGGSVAAALGAAGIVAAAVGAAPTMDEIVEAGERGIDRLEERSQAYFGLAAANMDSATNYANFVAATTQLVARASALGNAKSLGLAAAQPCKGETLDVELAALKSEGQLARALPQGPLDAATASVIVREGKWHNRLRQRLAEARLRLGKAPGEKLGAALVVDNGRLKAADVAELELKADEIAEAAAKEPIEVELPEAGRVQAVTYPEGTTDAEVLHAAAAAETAADIVANGRSGRAAPELDPEAPKLEPLVVAQPTAMVKSPSSERWFNVTSEWGESFTRDMLREGIPKNAQVELANALADMHERNMVHGALSFAHIGARIDGDGDFVGMTLRQPNWGWMNDSYAHIDTRIRPDFRAPEDLRIAALGSKRGEWMTIIDDDDALRAEAQTFLKENRRVTGIGKWRHHGRSSKPDLARIRADLRAGATASDVYSLGKLLGELNRKKSSKLRKLLKEATSSQPEKRPTMAEFAARLAEAL